MFKDFVNMTLLSVTHTKITEVGFLIGKTRSLLTGGLKTIPQYISLEFPISSSVDDSIRFWLSISENSDLKLQVGML